jgi:hypothetical protein
MNIRAVISTILIIVGVSLPLLFINSGVQMDNNTLFYALITVMAGFHSLSHS